jgi:Protein of unknown function (DUF3800)
MVACHLRISCRKPLGDSPLRPSGNEGTAVVCASQPVHDKLFMFIAYIDDSGTGDKDKPFQLMTAVVIPDTAFRDIELFASGSLLAFIPDKVEEFLARFEEFKAWELFNGYGPFDGIDQTVRFNIIRFLLLVVKSGKFPVIYGAVNKAELRRQVYSSANPVDICFRVCINGINTFIEKKWPHSFALVIADESNKDKKALRAAFYEYRDRMKATHDPFTVLHDDMYFGDSKYSIGIQLADLCGYFVSKHLQGDAAGEGFYGMIKENIVYSSIEPQPVPK